METCDRILKALEIIEAELDVVRKLVKLLIAEDKLYNKEKEVK